MNINKVNMLQKREGKLLLKSNKHFKCLHFFAIENLDLSNIKTLKSQIKSQNKDYQIKANAKEKPELTEEEKAKKKKKRKKILNICMFLLNIIVLGVVLAVSLTQQDLKTVLAPNIDWKYMGILIGIVALMIIVDAAKYFILIKSSTKKSRPFLAFKVSVLGKYYDAVTPMSTGGQPFQMMYLNKRGVKGDVATGIPLIRYIFWQIIYVILCTAVLLYSQFGNIGKTSAVITSAAWISVIGTLAIMFVIILLSVSKKVGPFLVIWVLKLLSKIKLVKNYQKTFRSVMRFVINYQKTMIFFAKNFFVVVSQLFLALVDTILYNIIPYFIYKAFLPTGTLTIVEVFIQSLICNLTLGFIPTPGASGGAEGIFSIIFGGAFSGSGLFWPLIIWRISTYYINLLVGLFVLVYDFAIGNKKAERLKEQKIGVYADDPKPTFRQTLKENRATIKIVETQEEDKLWSGVIKSSVNYHDQEHEDKDEIIEGDLVSSEEMKNEVSASEQVLKEVRIHDIKKRKAKKLKKQEKAEKHNKKQDK